ncbi:MAG: hypothetical protein M3N30_01775 [Bacteroidota bacterium]|nr:hypothetical protein [Bacteroidota bacterium]
MLTAIHRPLAISHESAGSLRSLGNKFLNWSADQQENRLGWQGIGFLALGCFFTPLTVLIIYLSGANPLLIIAALIAMEITLVTNLSTMPTKITIPGFFLGVVTDISIIVACAFRLI